jgi:hypothetical protein
MKRIENLPLRRAAAIIAAKLSRYLERRTGSRRIDMDREKNLPAGRPAG